ncbi:MAG: hypothetical protein BZ135_02265 [Methanosphaera sp. rholeuAM6]|nr:MAG: hypothetical protein BZ135_02265 [Methanosphaera sp. rholeuAM6]
MDKKIILVIIALLVVVVGGFLAYSSLSGEISFGTSKVTAPAGFEVTNHNETEVTFSNDKTKLSIKEFDNGTVNKHVKDQYKRYQDTDIVLNKTFTIAQVPGKAIILKDENNDTIHTYYFFEKNNKTYRLFSKGTYNKTALEEVISSIS